MRFSRCFAVTAAVIAMAASPAAAAEDPRFGGTAERHRAAFAGATFRLPLGGPAAAAPEARLGIGFADYSRDGTGALVGGGHALPLQAGMSDGRLRLFVGGERLSRLERRLGVTDGETALLAAGGLAAGVLAVVLLSGGGEDGPCPPGVEVCTQ